MEVRIVSALKEQGNTRVLLCGGVRSCARMHACVCRQAFSRSWGTLAGVQPGACSSAFASSCIRVWVETFVPRPGIVISARAIPLFGILGGGNSE